MSDKRTAFVDCDETLITWDKPNEDCPEELSMILQCEDDYYRVYPMIKNINLISELRAVGWKIVVWSQGGADHAERVVKLLKLEDKVDLIVSKPAIYVDDLPFEAQMIKRVYKK